MMELVDMQGLKPCPLLGPGSSPGVGISFVFIVYLLFSVFYVLCHCFTD